MAWFFRPAFPTAKWNTVLVYLSTLFYLYIPDNLLVAATVEQLLERGTRLMISGQLNDALTVFMQAVDEDPDNHLTHFRRGTAYFALGSIRLAYVDFSQSIKLNAGFRPALKQRGNTCMKMGKLQEARSDFGSLTHDDPEAAAQLTLINELEVKYQDAEKHFKNKNYDTALSLLNSLIDVINFDPKLRKMRSRCYFEQGDVQKGIQDLRNAVHMLNDNREGLLELSITMYEHGLAIQSLEEIRECLRLDQDDKQCMKHYKMVKKLAKAVSKAQEFHESSQYSECIQHSLEILKLEPNKPTYQTQAKQYLCHCYAKSNNPDGIPYCEVINEIFPNNPDYQLDLAEAYISGDRFDDAIRLCQSVLDESRRNQRARDLLNRAQKLLKASKRKDYYKILGVSRSSTKPEIMKAYRKLAAKWHPDKYEGKDKKSAETKFIEIAAAKDVLTDPDLRARYDNGEDPLDPSSQQGPQGPFGGFTFTNMHPFEGGHFEFHFG